MTKNLKLICIFLTFMLLFIVNQLLPNNIRSPQAYTARLLFICFVTISVITIYIIIKTKKLKKKDIFVAILFGILSGMKSPFMGVTTIVAYIGSSCILKYIHVNVPIFKDKTFKGIIKSAIIATICGCLLGMINLLLGMKSSNISVSFSIVHLINALQAGITEEIAYRLFPFAICVYFLKDNPKTKFQSVLCYFIMTVPHVLMHFPDMIATNGIGSIIMSVVVLTLLFGLPFALLLRKRDLFSAIAAHTLVDVIRFTVLGI
ncbi:CPBP family glutamic-type intramembrane protease [Dethiothermospora halolimnae]|uniref:CPBP family glutamic-type intramembrane protease n=1 Tax=Dethiothermospora halolimnae TaxID=3114390 RepID=UPI003CCBE2D4